MRITIISVGKLKEKYLTAGIAEYSKRLSSYAKIDSIEVPDEKAAETLSAAEAEQVKKKEAERILAKIPANSFVVVLAIEGKEMTSEQFAERIKSLGTYGQSRITFVIGGSLGLSASVLEVADLKLSFSKMTFPHQLMRLVLFEQLYRAFRIIHHAPYHK